MTEDKEDHQSEGKRLKSISVVISCLNESENISKCMRSTLAQKGHKNWGNQHHADGVREKERVRTKVVVVDGGSTDDTVLRAKKVLSDMKTKSDGKDEEEVIIVECAERGRAKQFNRGGRVVLRGSLEETKEENILVFLHADTTMPETYRDDIFDALRKERERRERERLFPSAWGVIKNGCSKLARRGNAKTDDAKTEVLPCWGAFPIKLSGERSKWRKNVVASLANFRTRRTSIPYGDQAIFVTASAFAKHKFDESKTFMEDYEYSLRLKKAFGKPALVSEKSPVTTDSRRFERVGFMNTTIINILCVVGYHLDVDVETLAKFYRNADKKDDR
tara:strand:- start:533 stop:1534 length:1002 start_codon:yes stop_codon:yes gene_type:complete